MQKPTYVICLFQMFFGYASRPKPKCTAKVVIKCEADKQMVKKVALPCVFSFFCARSLHFSHALRSEYRPLHGVKY